MALAYAVCVIHDITVDILRLAAGGNYASISRSSIYVINTKHETRNTVTLASVNQAHDMQYRCRRMMKSQFTRVV